jgi:isochorismate hydrolase
VSQDYLKKIKDYNIRTAKPRSGKCALLVIDMQEYFRAIASPIIGNVLSIIEDCRKKGVRVIYTRHGHKDVAKDGGMLGEWRGGLIQYGSENWDIIKAISPLDTDGILDKNRYSAFWVQG